MKKKGSYPSTGICACVREATVPVQFTPPFVVPVNPPNPINGLTVVDCGIVKGRSAY